MTPKVLLLAVFGLLAACKNDWQAAEQAAKDYATKVPNATGDVTCSHKDSDDDGYCSCSIFLKDGNIQPVECGCEKYCINCAEGCKFTTPFKMQTGR